MSKREQSSSRCGAFELVICLMGLTFICVAVFTCWVFYRVVESQFPGQSPRAAQWQVDRLVDDLAEEQAAAIELRYQVEELADELKAMRQAPRCRCDGKCPCKPLSAPVSDPTKDCEIRLEPYPPIEPKE